MVPLRSLSVLAVLLLASSAMAQQNDKLAVLDIWYDEGAISDSAGQVLTDLLRSAATEASAGRFDVMRRETMVKLLPPEQLRCAAGSCMATIGKMLQAQYVTGGTIRKVGSQLWLTVELYETHRESALGSTVLQGNRADDLLALLQRDGRKFLEKWLPNDRGSVLLPVVDNSPKIKKGERVRGSWSGPRVQSGEVKPAIGRLIVEVLEPRDGARIDVTSPSGSTLEAVGTLIVPDARPGDWRVTVSAEGYEAYREKSTVLVDQTKLVQVRLVRLASLRITGTPRGAEVEVKGPGGFTDSGPLPWEGQNLRSGQYGIHVSYPGYESTSTRVGLEPGKAESVEIDLRRLGGISVTGRPEGAEVVVTGPGAFRKGGGLPLRVEGITSGRYTVQVSRPGYRSLERVAHVVAGEMAEVRVALERTNEPEPPQEGSSGRLVGTGGVLVTGTPPGATATLSGRGWQRTGTTPWLVEGVPLGWYTLIVRKDGYSSEPMALQVAQGAPQVVSVNLKRDDRVVTRGPVRGSSGQGSPGAAPALPREPNVEEDKAKLIGDMVFLISRIGSGTVDGGIAFSLGWQLKSGIGFSGELLAQSSGFVSAPDGFSKSGRGFGLLGVVSYAPVEFFALRASVGALGISQGCISKGTDEEPLSNEEMAARNACILQGGSSLSSAGALLMRVGARLMLKGGEGKGKIHLEIGGILRVADFDRRYNPGGPGGLHLAVGWGP